MAFVGGRIFVYNLDSCVCWCSHGFIFICCDDVDINIAKKSAAYVKYLPLGVGIFVVFNILIIYFFVNTFENINYNAINSINIISESNTENLGFVLFTDYILEFEIAGLILLLGIISAIVLTYRKILIINIKIHLNKLMLLKKID